MYYWLLRVGLQTISRLSDSIRLGWRTGFDSGVMLEYIYENQPRGITPLGVWFDHMFTAHPVWDDCKTALPSPNRGRGGCSPFKSITLT